MAVNSSKNRTPGCSLKPVICCFECITGGSAGIVFTDFGTSPVGGVSEKDPTSRHGSFIMSVNNEYFSVGAPVHATVGEKSVKTGPRQLWLDRIEI